MNRNMRSKQPSAVMLRGRRLLFAALLLVTGTIAYGEDAMNKSDIRTAAGAAFLEGAGDATAKVNLAYVGNGAKSATASSVIPNCAEHEPKGVNDGQYGNASGWICAPDDRDPWFQIDLGKEAKVGCVALGRDRKRLVLLPATAELVPDDKSIRPDGTACRIKADLDKADKGAYALTLTEFADPDGQWTSFQLADPKSAVEDELLSPGNK